MVEFKILIDKLKGELFIRHHAKHFELAVSLHPYNFCAVGMITIVILQMMEVDVSKLSMLGVS